MYSLSLSHILFLFSLKLFSLAFTSVSPSAFMKTLPNCLYSMMRISRLSLHYHTSCFCKSKAWKYTLKPLESYIIPEVLLSSSNLSSWRQVHLRRCFLLMFWRSYWFEAWMYTESRLLILSFPSLLQPSSDPFYTVSWSSLLQSLVLLFDQPHRLSH